MTQAAPARASQGKGRRAKTLPPSRPFTPLPAAPQPLDGTAIAAAVKRYRNSEITVAQFLDELRSLRVNDSAATRLAAACPPKPKSEAAP